MMARYQMTIISAVGSLDALRRLPNHFFLSIYTRKYIINVDFAIRKIKKIKSLSFITIVHIRYVEMNLQ